MGCKASDMVYSCDFSDPFASAASLSARELFPPLFSQAERESGEDEPHPQGGVLGLL